MTTTSRDDIELSSRASLVIRIQDEAMILAFLRLAEYRRNQEVPHES